MPRKGGGKMPAVVKVTQKQLAHIASQPYAIRKGATVNPPSRAAQYSHEGYRGVMYEAPTQNMKRAENKLLENPGIHNQQTHSNVAEKPGHVYVVKGRKSSKK